MQLPLILVGLSIIVAVSFAGAYFWLPAWYGWVSLSVGIAPVAIAGIAWLLFTISWSS